LFSVEPVSINWWHHEKFCGPRVKNVGRAKIDLDVSLVSSYIASRFIEWWRRAEQPVSITGGSMKNYVFPFGSNFHPERVADRNEPCVRAFALES